LAQMIETCPLSSRAMPSVDHSADALDFAPARGFLGLADGDDDNVGNPSDHAFLCSLPLGSDFLHDDWLVSSWDVSVTGAGLFSSLLRLKHLGCIYNAAEGLRKVCSRLLRLKHVLTPVISSGPPLELLRLGELPRAWLDSLLGHVRQAGQFILRRSAGFGQVGLLVVWLVVVKPFNRTFHSAIVDISCFDLLTPFCLQAFLAIASSEPHGDHGNSVMLLRYAAEELLRCAGAAKADFSASEMGSAAAEESAVNACSDLFAAGRAGQESGDWRTRVHAMNILRLFFKDSQVCARVFLLRRVDTAWHAFFASVRRWLTLSTPWSQSLFAWLSRGLRVLHGTSGIAA
jgi:hypothetical protein